MAAKLEWMRKQSRRILVARADEPWLDGAEVGRVARWGVGGWGYVARIGSVQVETDPQKYSTRDAAMADLESEVRRLLREAGVEVT